MIVHELVVLQNSNYIVLQSLLSETWCPAVLDSGATSTVCGKVWFDEYFKRLPSEQQSKSTYTRSSKSFRFGDGRQLTSVKATTIPATVGSCKVEIKTDIIDSDILLLLSKAAMKKAQIVLNFNNDTITFQRYQIKLNITSNDLYYFPITEPKSLINSITKTGNQDQLTLRVTVAKSNTEIAHKLHRSFAHPSTDKLLKLLKNAGGQWANNKELHEEIKNITEKCQICKINKKPPPQPVVSSPMASHFQETVAIDLKIYRGQNILHLIDLCTRLSAAAFIPNKNR